MLCGIGGNTIEEAQCRLSYQEFCSWADYKRKRGTLNVGMRVEHAAALIAQMLANRWRKSGSEPFKVHDFSPHMDEPELTIKDLTTWE